jgi:DNA ligase-associated metallophosphoesterase
MLAQPAPSPVVDPSATPIVVNGARLLALRDAALWWPDEATLIVSDLHLEKGSAFAARGVPLPPYDTGEALRRLEALIETWQPARVISLGDTFHDIRAGDRMAARDLERLQELSSARTWVWIEGNHDPETPACFEGVRAAEVRLGPLLFRHEPAHGIAAGEIAGHLHPATVIQSETGRRVRARCFASDGSRLVMPAFGPFTGGLNVLDPAFQPVFPRGCSALAIGRARVFTVGHHRLQPDRG